MRLSLCISRKKFEENRYKAKKNLASHPVCCSSKSTGASLSKFPRQRIATDLWQKKKKKKKFGSSIVHYADYMRMEFTNAHRLRIELSIHERNLSVSARVNRDFELMNRTLSLSPPPSLSSPAQFRFVLSPGIIRTRRGGGKFRVEVAGSATKFCLRSRTYASRAE